MKGRYDEDCRLAYKAIYCNFTMAWSSNSARGQIFSNKLARIEIKYSRILGDTENLYTQMGPNTAVAQDAELS